ncbi:MAG TPA: 50S ribosomal protein L1, partial [Acidimicrobiia bacterium]|nr:50S ribosomal protein L1 [Acidimicrobiia bacterium]
MSQGKKIKEAYSKVNPEHGYPVEEAFALLTTTAKESTKRAFDESVDVVFRLGVDPRKADQMIRGSVALPNGTGKTIRIAVFAQGEAATAAKAAGADFVGADELVQDVEKGMMDFDLVIAAPDMMAKVGKLGRALGPRGLMPNPKTGTVTPDVAKAVADFKSGKVEYRTDRDGNVHVRIGKASFEPTKLGENFAAVLDEIQRAKPASSKGRYIKNISAS